MYIYKLLYTTVKLGNSYNKSRKVGLYSELKFRRTFFLNTFIETPLFIKFDVHLSFIGPCIVIYFYSKTN